MGNTLGIVDYIVLFSTLIFSLLIGIYFMRRKQNATEMLSGNKKMQMLPIAASMIVSYMSAITILGYPAEVYNYGVQFYMMILGAGLFQPIAIYMIVSVLYYLNLTSTYQYLEMRFESKFLRKLCAGAFIVQTCLLNAIVLYAPAIPMETMLGLPVWISILIVGLFATIYTSVGGLRAVVWTDVFQFVMIVIGVSAILIQGFIATGGISEAFIVANDNGRLNLFDGTIDPFMRHNTLNLVLGNGFATIYLIGTYQPIVQRYCSLPSFASAVRAIAVSYFMGMLTIGLVTVTGIAIYATYANCDPVSTGEIEKADEIVPYFVIDQLGFIPGMMGLFISVIFSAVLSTISSSLNSQVAVIWEDFLSKRDFIVGMNEDKQTLVYKVTAGIFGLLAIGLAFIAKESATSIFQMANAIFGMTSGVQAGIFLAGLFLPFTNKIGALTGQIVGLCVLVTISANAFLLQRKYEFSEKLDFTTDGCDPEFNSTLPGSSLLPLSELEWPAKLFSVSYILYSPIGGLTAIIVAATVSSISHFWIPRRPVPPQYLHKLVRNSSGTKLPTQETNYEETEKPSTSGGMMDGENTLSHNNNLATILHTLALSN